VRGRGPRAGMRSCKHEFVERIPYLGHSDAYLLRCRCGKTKKAWGLYDARLPGKRMGRPPRVRDDQPERDSSAG
jgi:hypothetical protein